MPRLTAPQLRSRLCYDFEVVRRMGGESLHVAAFRRARDAQARRNALDLSGEAEPAEAYLIGYPFPCLSGPGTCTEGAWVLFDLLCTGDYPFSPPAATVVSRPVPWTPHFAPGSGLVCLGPGWEEARGQMLFAHLVVHVARLLNFDEPVARAHTGGFVPEAYAYWRDVLHHRPLHPELVYPRLPLELTHGVESSPTRRLFQVRDTPAPARERPVFRVRRVP